MRTLEGNELIIYLNSLKAYELELSKKRPIGERVRYYKIKTDWINDELKHAQKEGE